MSLVNIAPVRSNQAHAESAAGRERVQQSWGHSQGPRKTRARSSVATRVTRFHPLWFSFRASCLQPFSFKDIAPCRAVERHHAISNQARHLSPGQSGGRRIPPAPARTFWQARNETTSDISRLPKKKPVPGMLSRRRTTINMPNTITDQCRETETGHRRAPSSQIGPPTDWLQPRDLLHSVTGSAQAPCSTVARSVLCLLLHEPWGLGP